MDVNKWKDSHLTDVSEATARTLNVLLLQDRSHGGENCLLFTALHPDYHRHQSTVHGGHQGVRGGQPQRAHQIHLRHGELD